MLKGLYTAYTGMVNEQHRMDTLTNNLANSTTVGFKKEGATSQAFDEVLALKIKDTSESPNTARRLGTMSLGVKIGENYTDYSEGPLKVTDNTFDLALTGPGFFTIEFTNKAGETSTKYTRDGSFTVTEEGNLVTKDGDFVLDDGGSPIELNPRLTTSINTDGTIYQNGRQVAKIGITDFEDYNYLKKYGDVMYQPVDGAVEKEATGLIRQGYTEQSNVNVVTEMVNMIAITRAYEANQKVIQSVDQTLDQSANSIGRV